MLSCRRKRRQHTRTQHAAAAAGSLTSQRVGCGGQTPAARGALRSARPRSAPSRCWGRCGARPAAAAAVGGSSSSWRQRHRTQVLVGSREQGSSNRNLAHASCVLNHITSHPPALFGARKASRRPAAPPRRSSGAGGGAAAGRRPTAPATPGAEGRVVHPACIPSPSQHRQMVRKNSSNQEALFVSTGGRCCSIPSPHPPPPQARAHPSTQAFEGVGGRQRQRCHALLLPLLPATVLQPLQALLLLLGGRGLQRGRLLGADLQAEAKPVQQRQRLTTGPTVCHRCCCCYCRLGGRRHQLPHFLPGGHLCRTSGSRSGGGGAAEGGGNSARFQRADDLSQLAGSIEPSLCCLHSSRQGMALHSHSPWPCRAYE